LFGLLTVLKPEAFTSRLATCAALCCLGMHMLFAHPPLSPKDSLIQRWENPELADTTRLEALWTLIDEHLDSQNTAGIDSSLAYLQQLYDFSAQTQQIAYRAIAASSLGQDLIRKGAYQDALPYVQEALTLNEQLGQEQAMANDYISLGIILRRRGEFQQAIESYTKAGAIYLKGGDSLNFAASQINLSVIYDAVGNSKEAVAVGLEALKVVQTDPQSPYLLPLLLNLGSSYHSLGNIPHAISYYEQARLKAQQAGNQRVFLGALIRIAILYKEQDEYELARKSLAQSLHISDSLNSYSGQNESLRGLTNTYLAEEGYEEALTFAEKGLALAEKQGDEGAMYDFEMFMGNCLWRIGRREEAEKYVMRAMKRISSPLDARLGRAYLTLAQIKVDQQEWAQAKTYAEMGFEVVEESSNVREKLNLVGLLVPIYKHFGNTRKTLEMLELKQVLSDSLFNAENQRNLIRQEYEYAYMQQAYQDSVQNAASLAIAEEETLRRKTVSNLLLCGLFLTLIFGAILLNRFRITRRQKHIIEQEKTKLDQAYNDLDAEKNKLSVANAQLKELDDFKSHFFTNISHEFRTPLTVIDGMAKQMRQQPERFMGKGIDLIERNAGSLLHLINQILDLRKLESNKLQLALIQDDVVQFLRFQTGAFESLAESRGIGLSFQSDTPQLYMDFDPDKLGKIQRNLLSNALKFTPAGGTIRVEVLCPDSAQLLIRVIDTGMGIPPEKISRIFDRFYQVNTSDTREGEGTGIGLSLTMELVHLMKGSIQVESEEGKGSAFELTLPIQQQAVRQAAAAPLVLPPGLNTPLPLVSEAETNGTSDLPRLLIIEDNPDIVQYLTACLEGQYELSAAPDGQVGIEAALEQIPDIIISDVMMPRKNGYEVCDILKQDLRTSHIPILLLTAKADQPSRLEGYKRGADAYLPKPFDQEELLIRLNNLLQTRKRLQARYSSATAPIPSEQEEVQIEDAFVAKIRESILENIDDPEFGIEALYPLLGMSRTSFYRKVKALTGSSASHFVRAVRIEQAKELLKQRPDMQIAEVAYATGFMDPSYFGRVFKEVAGIAPGDFREK